MKTILLIICAFVISSSYSKSFNDGDIIFQTSKSAQSKMLKIATNPNLTHVGIIFYKNGAPYVYEAVQPVKVTPLQKWIARGEGGHYKVMRPKFKCTKSDYQKMMGYAKKQLGKAYDLKFGWNDSKMYCSELVWKCYYSAGYKLCEPKQFKNFNLDSKIVKKAISQRYSTGINPNEKVVAPVDLYNSSELNLIYSNY